MMQKASTERIVGPFQSGFAVVGRMPDFGIEDMKREQTKMLFSADRWFAYEHGGGMVASFIDNLPKKWQESDLIIDTRVHMLKPGWYPCIPGYHLDDIPRGMDGQPNLVDPAQKAEHVLACVGDVSLTKFVVGEFHLPEVPGDFEGPAYGWYHRQIEKLIGQGSLRVTEVPNRAMAYFGYGDWHRGSAAIGSGWRFFVRASRNSPRETKNEIRFQTQVYMDDPIRGW